MPIPIIIRIIAACVVVILSTSAGSPLAPRLKLDTPPTPISRFGAVEAFYRGDDATELGVGWDRMIFEWRYLQPNGPDDWDPSAIPDKWLQTDTDAHREIVGLIKNAPHWATGSELLGAPPLGLDKPINDPENLLAAFVKKLTTYYAAHWNIHHWIIYNEPDIRPEDTDQFEFSGDETDYYHVVKVAYQAAHAADPKAVIHLAGFTWWQDVVHKRLLYFERWLRIAAKDPDARAHHLFFDVLSIHVYTDTQLVWRITNQLHSLAVSVGYSPPVWIDEMNAQVTTDGDWRIDPRDKPITLDQQVAFIVQASALGLALNAQRIGVYRLWDDTDPGTDAEWGLVRHDGSRRPAYDAYHTVIQEFSATVSASRISNHGVTIVTLRQPKRSLSIIWNETYEPITARALVTPGARLLLPNGDDVITNTVSHGTEFTLPPCSIPCAVQGEPRILILAGASQAIYLVRKGTLLKIN